MKNTEIERKYLVIPDLWARLDKPAGRLYIQGYLCNDETKTIRIRIIGDLGILTIKSRAIDYARREFEYPIPVDEAEELLHLFGGSLVKKIRYKVPFQNYIWEVDEFRENNSGLILAEIELGQPFEDFDLPDWVGKEVTGDRRYYNSYLAVNPYNTWKK